MGSKNIVWLFLITLEKVPTIYASRPEYPLELSCNIINYISNLSIKVRPCISYIFLEFKFEGI